jgi:hypothetical protein
MSMTPAVVTTAEPAAETPARSAASAALARARRSRKDADAALSEAVKAQKAAEQLVVAPDKIRARIMELEGKTVGAVEPWATTGGVRQATLPHTEELDELRRQLAEAERTADAARLAMPTLNITVRSEKRGLRYPTRSPPFALQSFRSWPTRRNRSSRTFVGSIRNRRIVAPFWRLRSGISIARWRGIVSSTPASSRSGCG